MSSAVDCTGSKLITLDYYWLFFLMSLAFHRCASCYFSILFAVITLTSSKSESQFEAVDLILLVQVNWRFALA